MSNIPEDIDHFFKQNIDKIDVKYNAAHWDKLQQSLLSTSAVKNPPPAIKTVTKFKRLLFIGIPAIVIVTIGIYYFWNKKQLNKPMNDSIKVDSTKGNIVNPDTSQIPTTTNNFNNSILKLKADSLKHNKKLRSDSNKKSIIPVLFHSSEKDSVVHSFKRDSVNSVLKDTIQEHKKKKLDPFW